MSYVTAWIHYVWTTQNRLPVLSKEIREKLFLHIQENSKGKEIWMDSVNGHLEHVHCLVSLGKEQTISKVAQLIKGESAHWLNKSGLMKNKFIWQDDYYAVSVSHSQIVAVRKYIFNQEEHHRKKSFTEEVNEFMRKYEWEKLG
jgi:putative transposase